MFFHFVKTSLLRRSNLDGFNQKSIGCKFKTIIKFEIIVELLNSEIINLIFDGVSNSTFSSTKSPMLFHYFRHILINRICLTSFALRIDCRI